MTTFSGVVQLVVTDMSEVCVKKLSCWTLTFPSVRAGRAVLGRARRCCLLHDHLGWSVTAKWRASRLEFDISRQHRQFDVGLQRTEVQKIRTNSQFAAERYACLLSRLQCRNRGRLNGQSNIHRVSKKTVPVLFFLITPWNTGRFKYFLACNIMKKIDISDCSPPHLNTVATLPCEIQKS